MVNCHTTEKSIKCATNKVAPESPLTKTLSKQYLKGCKCQRILTGFNSGSESVRNERAPNDFCEKEGAGMNIFERSYSASFDITNKSFNPVVHKI